VTEKHIGLDQRRRMAAQKATEVRQLLAEVAADQEALHYRQDELEAQLIAALGTYALGGSCREGSVFAEAVCGHAGSAGSVRTKTYRKRAGRFTRLTSADAAKAGISDHIRSLKGRPRNGKP